MKLHLFTLGLGLFYCAKIAGQATSMQQLIFGDIHRTITNTELTQTPYFISGSTLYEIGTMDGSFPQSGSDQEEHGIWSHPVKFLNGFSFEIIEENQPTWFLNNANSFENNFFQARFCFSKSELQVIREDFVSENESALYSKLRVENKSGATKKIKLNYTGHINIQPSWRAETMKNSQDSIYYQSGLIFATDTIGSLIMGSKHKSCDHFINKNNATLTYELSIPPHDHSEITFLVLTNINTTNKLQQQLAHYHKLIDNYTLEKNKKENKYHNTITQNVQFSCSEKDITDAFYCAKANILMNIKDASPYFKGSFIGAGVPVYPRLFGTDFCFSAPGCLSGGYHTITKSTLTNLLQYTQQNLRAPHEISSDGVLLGWDHIQVSPQLIDACWEYFKWTKDTIFLEEAYPICIRMIEDIETNSELKKGLYPTGHGLMEEADFKNNWVDLTTAAYMYAGYNALSQIAKIMHHPKQAHRYAQKATDYKKSFHSDWWDADRSIWASALSGDGEKVFNNFWNVVFPQKAKVADSAHGTQAFQRISKDWVNDTWGMIGQYKEGADHTQSGVGIVHNNICATAAFQYGQTTLGWKLIQLSSKGPLHLKNSPLGLFPECQPTGCSNISQLWSYATFIESIVKGLFGVEPDYNDNPVTFNLHIPDNLSNASLENIQIGKNLYTVKWKKSNHKTLDIQINSTVSDKKKQPIVNVHTAYPYKISIKY